MKNYKVSAKLFVFGAAILYGTQATALGIPVPPDMPRPPAPTPAPDPGDFAALWNGKHPDAFNWTNHMGAALTRHGDSLLKGSDDMADFCPMYDRLGHQEHLNFWTQLFAAVVKFESGFNPSSRMTETTMGIDPVTGSQVASEGLLQLSYQDERSYKSSLPQGVCDFDFDRDRAYALGDIRRTILDPKTNLTCGVWILNKQVARQKKIGVTTGVYWSVLKPGGKYSKLAEIQAITKKLPFCR